MKALGRHSLLDKKVFNDLRCPNSLLLAFNLFLSIKRVMKPSVYASRAL